MRRLGTTLLIVWLIIGTFAAYQRGYFSTDREVSCTTAGDTLLTVGAGVLNYTGVNPQIDCEIPEPSQ